MPTPRALALLLLALALAPAAGAVDTADTALLSQPALSDRHVAFVYDGDVWVAERSGGAARRLTTAEGDEANPVFSPDGRTLAFSARYDGNLDVYVVPVEGGEPRRLTFHPGDDLVRGFAADGKAVLFQSPRSAFTRRHRHLYTVPVEGGMPTRLPIPTATKAAISPDGRRIAYVPLREPFGQWKNYRGGTASRIWIQDLADLSVVLVPQPEGRCNDTDPGWIGETLYFASDRKGEFNLHSFDLATRAVKQLTRHEGFPVIGARTGGGAVVYEQEGRLHAFDPVRGTSERLRIGVGADLREARPRLASGAEWVRAVSPAPDGKRVALEFRGEIVTVPAEKGDARNLSRSPGAHDRSPAWSPDGKTVAWLSDQGGEYSLHVAPEDGRGPARRIAVPGAGFYEDLRFSPDGRKLSLRDNSLTLWVVDVPSGKASKVAQEPVYGPIVTMTHSWSPDSRWLAYTLNAEGLVQTVHLYSVEQDRSYPVTDGMSEMAEPVFDASGQFLYMLGSTDAGPLKDWFAQSNADIQVTSTVYAAVLAKDGPSPLPPQSDETGARDEEKAPAKAEAKGKPEADKARPAAETEKAPAPVRFDPAGILDRIVPLGVPAGTLRNLRAGARGEIYYLETRGRTGGDSLGGPAELKRFTLEEREAKVLGRAVVAFELTRDGKKLLHAAEGPAGRLDWFLADAGKDVEAGKGRLPVDKVSVPVEPRAEWAQIFREAWRINRDWFYATNYHGVDWAAVRRKYEPFLPHLATRADLERVIVWMASELSVGHSYSGGGESIDKPKAVKVGLLGADYEAANGRYRFRKVYGGLNWTPDLRSPLRTPGVAVSEGEYLLAVNGVEVKPPENLYRLFENAAGAQVRLKVGPDPTGAGSREVTVVPVDDESALRLRAWAEANQRQVDAATGGKVAYVHVPNTAEQGHAWFKRYFYPQSHKAALILDERLNGGGSVADYYIDILRRPYIASWAMRYGADLVSPRAAIFGPKVMLIDESAGSGGDLLPWMFRKLGLGTLVGRRTWGGLVGILGYPVLMDGGQVTAPNLAIWTDEGWIVENEGVPPDVEVEQWPAEVEKGRDPQLERAIELALAALEKSPPVERKRPPYPVRNPRGPR